MSVFAGKAGTGHGFWCKRHSPGEHVAGPLRGFEAGSAPEPLGLQTAAHGPIQPSSFLRLEGQSEAGRARGAPGAVSPALAAVCDFAAVV